MVKKGSTGKFRFNLVSTNGQVVATSEAYSTKASAMGGIRSVKALAADAEVEDQTVKESAKRTGLAGSERVAKRAAANAGGGACGYYSNVGLFGNPQERRGCGQTVPPGDARSASPAVELPAGGSASAITDADTDGAMAEHGPAVIFGGKSVSTGGADASGAIQVSTKGMTTVTSSASVKNVGTGPFTANSVTSTCTASKSGVKGTTAITKGFVVTATDANGNPKTTKAVPAKPRANLSMTGKVPTGDKFKIVFNEQKKSRDGTLTVVAVHLYLLGPVAVGDVVVAESHSRA